AGGEGASHAADVAAVRFVVEADGRAIFDRTLDPAHDGAARRWVAADVALPPTAGAHDLVLRTERAGPGARVPGAAGWSHVRIVERSTRERQTASPRAPSVVVLL